MNTETKLIAANSGGGRIYNTWGIYLKGTRIAEVFDIDSPERQHELAEQFASAPDMAAELAKLRADKAELLEALQTLTAEIECYCCDTVAARTENCGYCIVRALLSKHSTQG